MKLLAAIDFRVSDMGIIMETKTFPNYRMSHVISYRQPHERK